MGPARIYPWRKMHRSRAPSIAPGTFFVAQPWADCITNMPGFNLRQAQLAIPRPCWQTEGLGRAAHAHWRDEPCEHTLGRAAYSWRVAQARLRVLPVDGRSVHVPPLAATVSGLADVSQQSRRRHRGDRPLCPADDRLTKFCIVLSLCATDDNFGCRLA